MHAIDGTACAKRGCDNRGTLGLNIVGRGSFSTKWGRRWRYCCTVCGETVSTNTGTAYSGLRCARRAFDQVARLRVEGVSMSATARVTGHSRHTIARWLERASTAAKRVNQRMLRDFAIIELPADALCTFIGNKSSATWWCGHRGVCPIVGRERARPPRLSKRHGRPQRRHPPRTRGGMPADRDRWVRVRRWGECAPLWVGVRLWSRAQDSAERSRRPSRTAPEDRHGGSAAGCAVGVGGFRDPAHLVRRASQPHDSPRLGVLAPSLALPRPWRRPAPRARRPLALL